MKAALLQVYLVLAVLGWGMIASQVLRSPPGLGGPIGLAMLTALGGGLIAADALSSGVLVATTLIGGIGCLGWFWRFRPSSQSSGQADSSNKGQVKGIAYIVGTALLARVGSLLISPNTFNGHDDFQGYLMFPIRLLAEGHLIDPFDGRRLIAGLSAKTFLDSLVLAHLQPIELFFAERVLGHVLMLLALLLWVREELLARGMSRRVLPAVLIIAGVFFCSSAVEARFQANISATTSASALLLALIVLIERIERERLRGVGSFFALGMVAAAACAFKSNLIPAVAFLVCGAAFLSLPSVLGRSASFRARDSAARVDGNVKDWGFAWSIAGGAAAILLAPWMLEMYRSSGTLLYPVFGKGNYSLIAPVARAWDFVATPSAILRTFTRMPFVFATATLYLLWRFVRRRDSGVSFVPGLVVCAMLGQMLAIGASTGGDSMLRYGFTFFMAAVCYMGGRILVDADDAVWERMTQFVDRHKMAGTGLFIGLVAALAASTVLQPRGHVLWRPSDSEIVRHGFDAALAQRYARLAAALPPQVPVLAFVDYPFLLDFRRNRVYTSNLPCVAFPAPGFDCNRPPGELVKLLRGQGIRYVVFSYKNEANFAYDQWMPLLDTSTPLIKALGRGGLAFIDLMRYLVANTPHVYDDGFDVVLDLAGFVDPGDFALPEHSVQRR